MGCYWLNLRVLRWHLTWTDGHWFPRVGFNDYWAKYPLSHWPWIEMMTLTWPYRLWRLFHRSADAAGR